MSFFKVFSYIFYPRITFGGRFSAIFFPSQATSKPFSYVTSFRFFFKSSFIYFLNWFLFSFASYLFCFYWFFKPSSGTLGLGFGFDNTVLLFTFGILLAAGMIIGLLNVISYFGIYLERRGLQMISSIDGLFFGLTWSRFRTSVLSSREKLPVIGEKDPFKIFKANNGSEFASNGSFCVHKLYSITPNAQMSAFVE